MSTTAMFHSAGISNDAELKMADITETRSVSNIEEREKLTSKKFHNRLWASSESMRCEAISLRAFNNIKEIDLNSLKDLQKKSKQINPLNLKLLLKLLNIFTSFLTTIVGLSRCSVVHFCTLKNPLTGFYNGLKILSRTSIESKQEKSKNL